MSCKFINPHTQNELGLAKILSEYYKLDDSDESFDFLKDKISYFFTDQFKESFGDWTQQQYPEDERIDADGAPKLYLEGENYYVLDINNEKLFINNRRFEGLELYKDYLNGSISQLTREATIKIVRHIFDKYKNQEDDLTDFSNFTNINLKNEIEDYFNKQIQEIPEKEDAYEIFKEFNKDFQLEIKDFLNSINLQFTEESSLDNDDSSYQDNLEDNGAVIGKGSVERNSKDNATSNIKLMLSLIPDVEKESLYFSGNSILPFDKVWGEIQTVLSDIPKTLTLDGKPFDPYIIIMDRLNKLASNKPYVKDLIDILDSSSEHLKTQFFQAFGNLGKNVQDTFEVTIDGVGENATYSFRSINAAESSSKKSKILTNAGIDFKGLYTIYNPDNKTNTFDLVSYNNLRNLYFKLTKVDLNDEVDRHGRRFNLLEKLSKINLSINNSDPLNINENLLIKQEELFNEVKETFIKLTQDLGFNMSPLTLDYYLSNNGKEILNVSNATNRIIDFTKAFERIDKFLINDNLSDANKIIKEATDKLFNNKGKYLNLFKGEKSSESSQKVITEIADAIAFFDTDMSEAMVQSGNKQIWSYSLTTHLFDKINILNNSSEEITKLLKQPFTKNSLFLKALSEGNKIKLHRTNSMMETDKAGESVDNTTTSKIDAIVRDVAESLMGKKLGLKSIYSTPVPADKGTALKLETGTFINTNIRIVNNKIIVNDDTLNIFKGYFNDELSNAAAAKKFIIDNIDNEGNVDTTNLVQYTHVDAKGNVFDILDASGKSIFNKGANSEINRNNINNVKEFIEENKLKGYRMIYAGNVFKNYMTPSLSPENLVNKPDIFGLFYNSDFTPLNDNYNLEQPDTLTPAQHTYLNDVITNLLNDVIKSHQSDLIENGIFNSDGTINRFDKDLYKEYQKDTEFTVDGIMSQIVSDYTINNIIAQIEYSKIFNGQINSHKNVVDYFKRVPKTYIDGKGLRLGITENDHISHVAVLQDMEVSSPYLEEMGLNEAEVNFAKKYYGDGKINQADAQAYITPERWKFLLERLGQFGPSEQKIYSKIQQMERGENVEFTSKELKKLSTKPLKGVYFSNENNKPLYLKYSQSVLLKSFVKGSPLEKLLDQMRSQSIDEAIMASGVKVGAQFAKENVSEAILTNNDKFTLKSIPIDNRFWKLQQDLPNKGFKETLLGSQMQKNLFDNFTFGTDKTYTFNDKSYSGDEVYDNIHSIIGELSNRGLEKIKKKFAIAEDYTINNWGDFAKDIAQQLREEKIDENVVKAVEKELTPYVVPQARDKILSTIMSKINKAAVKLKTDGGSVIQMSNFGLDQNLADETGITWIKNKQQLAEPRKILDKDGNPKVLPGQVFISGNLLGQHIPNWKDYSLDELFGEDRQGGIFPKEVLQIIGYRIPNQAMSSNDALEVVGVLPDTYIDTIIPYTGITTKTGSDFDIDKMFLVLPSMNVVDGNVKYTEYDDSKTLEEQSIGALNNRLFEMYHSILTHPNNYENLITPIDYPDIKDFITKKLFPSSGKMSDYKAFSPLYQIEMKYEFIAGGFGIGQVANQLVDSIANQVSQNSLDYYIGWGNYKTINVDGKNIKKTVFDMKSDKGVYDESGQYKIASMLTALLNGFVDIAKDPYITRGNWNTQTTNTGTFLIRAGVHPFKVCAFLAQPSLVEMVNEISSKEGKTSSDKTSGNVLPILKEKYLNKLKESLNFDDENFRILKADIDSKKLVNLSVKNLSNNKITNRSVEDLQNNITNKDILDTPQYYLDQYLALVEYDNLKPTVKEFTKAVGASKYGEKGIGKNLSEYLVQYNKTQDVIDNNIIIGFEKKFYNPDLIAKGYTSLGTYQKNTEEFFKNLIDANPRIFITANKFFSNIMNNMALEIHNNKRYLDDIELGKVLEQSMYTMVTSNSKIFHVKDSEFEYLFGKSTENLISLSQNIVDARTNYREQGVPNFFLENIEIKEDGVFSFIGIDGVKTKTNDFKKLVSDAWRDLEMDYPSLSDDLVKYAYQQSGFRYNANQIYQFIPHEIFVKNRINNYLNKVSDDIINNNISYETIEDNIYRHNVDNTSIVPRVSKKNISIQYPNDAGFRLSYDSNRHSGQGLLEDGTKIFTYPKFVSKDDNLYKLAGYKAFKDSKTSEVLYEPVYFRTFKLGYKSKQGQFHEYSMYKPRTSSRLIDNNIPENSQNIINGIISHSTWKDVIKYDEIGKITSDDFMIQPLTTENESITEDLENINDNNESTSFSEEDLGLNISSTQDDTKC